jgi:hypothetical protein
MTEAASLSIPELSFLMDKMPAYRGYRTAAEAATAERAFRHALGSLLRECGERLLNLVDAKDQVVSAEMEDKIDDLVDRIGLIFRRLDREGIVHLVAGETATIAELEELDTRLILMVEQALGLVRNLGTGVPAANRFQSEAERLSHGLAVFSEMAEERNYLLGLGWESEFTRRKGI